jgi:hypothetical protein
LVEDFVEKQMKLIFGKQQNYVLLESEVVMAGVDGMPPQ